MSSNNLYQPREEISECPIELYFQHGGACRNGDWPDNELQHEIDKAYRERREVAPAQHKQARQVMREKAVVRQAAKKVRLADQGRQREETTETGLSVEGQIRKQWNPGQGGLPTFLRA